MTWSQRLGRTWAAWRIRRRDLFAADIRSALASGGEALVFLPDDGELFRAGLGVCRRLSEWFSPILIVVLSESEVTPDVTDGELPVLAVPHAINRWGYPYRPVMRRVREMTPRVAVSLYPEFHLASAVLCVESGAPLRIGLRGPSGVFFNLQYTWRDTDSTPISAHYEKFVKMLADLRAVAAV